MGNVSDPCIGWPLVLVLTRTSQMAEQYPSAHVIGTDLSPIQPDFVPPNCNFEVEDVTLEWTYPLNKFDFIHIRELFGSVPDWSFLLGEVYRCTKPGG